MIEEHFYLIPSSYPPLLYIYLHILTPPPRPTGQEFISLDLTTSFSLEKVDDNGDFLPPWRPVTHTIDSNVPGEYPLAIANGGLWTGPDNNTLYLYEGQRIKGAEKSDQSTLLSFDIAAAKWSRETAWDNPDGSTPNRFAKGTSVNVPEIGMGFYVGGARMYAGADGEREWRYPVEQQMVGMDIGGGNYDAQVGFGVFLSGGVRASCGGVCADLGRLGEVVSRDYGGDYEGYGSWGDLDPCGRQGELGYVWRNKRYRD